MRDDFAPKRIPEELRARSQWLIWRFVAVEGRQTKRPFQCSGYPASVTNPGHHTSFENALAAYQRPGVCDGVGFVFTESDPFTGIDLDAVWNSDADEGQEWAWQIFPRFGDTYQEESPSGCGLKIWCRAKPPKCGKWPIGSGAVEVYDRDRFFTVTSRSNGIRIITDHQHDVALLIKNLERAKGAKPRTQHSGDIPPGHRHMTLVSICGSLWHKGACPEAILAALQEVNQRQCGGKYSLQHIQQIVRSARSWNR